MDGNTKITDLLEDDVAIEHKAHEDGAIDKDFYDKIKSWTQSELNDLENRFYSRPWFGKAWQEYRSHVLNTEQKNIRNPGYIFKKYIADDKDIPVEQKEHMYLSEDYMWYELRTEKERMADCAHSIEIGKDYLMHYNENHDPKTGQFAPKNGTVATSRSNSAQKKVTNKDQVQIDEKTVKAVHTQIKSTQDVANGVSAVANQTANLLPDHTGKTVHGSYPDLSNQEIQDRINRMNLEQRYSDLKGDTKYIPSGKDKTREALQNIGIVAGIGASIAGIALAIHQMRNPGINLGGGKKK